SLILGVLGGAPLSASNLTHMASILPQPSTWEVIGISRDQWKVIASAASLGGNVRVGLEDNFYVPSGEMASSNGDLIDAAARLVQLAGRKVAEPAEARRLLSLPDPPDRTALESPSAEEPLGATTGSAVVEN
ncbi:MAG: 3-keto-5-aminohexanoate cleavage enzyme, partial [Actinomycetota bacterium]|nr:3-keto-5-aminohexanoate cleavage enzyme [Actinomycetota bacterium]